MLSVLAALAVLAQAEPAAYVLNPDWISKPSAQDLARAYPPRAAQYNTEGRGTLQCVVDGEGRLADCVTTYDFPAAEGFAEATLSLAPRFQMKPMDGDGRPVAGRPVRIPVRWVLPGRPFAHMEKLEVAMSCYGQAAHRTQQDASAKGAWQATAYWSLEVAAAVAGAGLRPLAYEGALAGGHNNAKAGATPPKGAEWETCLARASKP